MAKLTVPSDVHTVVTAMGECTYSQELRKLEAISDSLQLTPPCTAKAATPGESRKRTPRNVKQPHKTPVRSGDSSGSVVLQFQLVSGTPTPSLRIQASSNHRYALKVASVPGLPRSVRVLIMRRQQTFAAYA